MRNRFDMLHDLLTACKEKAASKKQLQKQTHIPTKTLDTLLNKCTKHAGLYQQWKTEPAGNRAYFTYQTSPIGNSWLEVLDTRRELEKLLGEN